MKTRTPPPRVKIADMTLRPSFLPAPEYFDLRGDESIVEGVHVWRIPLLVGDAELARLRTILSPDEIARADRFKFPIHQRRFAVGRATLRLLLARYLGILSTSRVEPSDLVFHYNAHGKPELMDCPFHFNLSNSHELALFAITQVGDVGVDIERLRELRNPEGMSSRYFSKREDEAFRACAPDERRLGFFRTWTLKESYIKARGYGLSIPLERFHIWPTEHASHYRVTSDETADDERWRFCSFQPDVEHIAALALAGPLKAISYWNWTADWVR